MLVARPVRVRVERSPVRRLPYASIGFDEHGNAAVAVAVPGVRLFARRSRTPVVELWTLTAARGEVLTFLAPAAMTANGWLVADVPSARLDERTRRRVDEFFYGDGDPVHLSSGQVRELAVYAERVDGDEVVEVAVDAAVGMVA